MDDETRDWAVVLIGFSTLAAVLIYIALASGG